jgi:hypothetical protein
MEEYQFDRNLIKNLIADKLSLTIQVLDKYAMRDRLDMLLNERAFYPESRGMYAKTVAIKYDVSSGADSKQNSHAVCFSIDGKYEETRKSRMKPLRVEFNPNNLKAEGMAKLRNDLEYILGNKYAKAVSEANITRIDVAIDFMQVELTDFAVGTMRSQKRGLWLNKSKVTGDTVIETVYMGDKRARSRFAYYKRSDGSIEEYVELTRFEARLKPSGIATDEGGKHSLLLKDIASLPNPFEHCRIFLMSHIVKAFSELPVTFADSCLVRGFNGACNLLDESLARQVKRFARRKDVQLFACQEDWNKRWSKATEELLEAFLSEG